MKRKAALLLLATAFVGLLVAPTASAMISTATPGGFIYGYTPPVVASQAGTQVTFHNADIQQHDFQALNDTHPDGTAPWCATFPTGGCPLFWSDLADLGQSVPVLGTESLGPGSYGFYCSIHPWMQGTLRVI